MNTTKQPLSDAALAFLLKEPEALPVRLVETGGSRILIYQTERGAKVELRYEDGTLWLTQSQIAELFGVDRTVAVRHLNNIYEEGELDRAATCAEIAQVQTEGTREVNRKVLIHNLDAIISVGYRVSSKQGTIFRRWATQTLVQFATKGFVIDKERLKDPEDDDRIAELRETIREIRASTANMYREVRRICAMCQDYDGRSETARNFYAGMENKLLFLATSATAPEILLSRADHRKPDMGLTTFPKTRPRQKDTLVANNYLTETEMTLKNRATSMLLDYFEEQVDQGKLVTMTEAEEKLVGFIKFNGWALMTGLGSTSRSRADAHAEKEYEKYRHMLAD